MKINEAQYKLCPILREMCRTNGCIMWEFDTIYKKQPPRALGLSYPPRPCGKSTENGDCKLKKL